MIEKFDKGFFPILRKSRKISEVEKLNGGCLFGEGFDFGFRVI